MAADGAAVAQDGFQSEKKLQYIDPLPQVPSYDRQNDMSSQGSPMHWNALLKLSEKILDTWIGGVDGCCVGASVTENREVSSVALNVGGNDGAFMLDVSVGNLSPALPNSSSR